MFNVGFAELMVVLLVAFLVVGPKDLPKVARWLARQVKAVKRMIREVKKETGWDEFSREFKETTDDIRQTVKDADVSGEIRSAGREVQQGLDEIRTEIDQASKDANIKGGN